MDITLTDEQQLIADSAAAMLDAACSLAQVRAVSEKGDGLDAALWKEVGALGWCGVHLPESVQGMGLGMMEVVLLEEQLGRHLACVPYFDSVVMAATLLRELPSCNAIQRLLTEVGAGRQILALAMASADAQAPISARATPVAGGWMLQGDWPLVGSAQWANASLLPAHTPEGELLLFLVPSYAQGLHVQAVVPLDATHRSADVSARAVELSADACLCRGTQLAQAWLRAGCLSAIALAAEQLGVAQASLDLTLSYTGQRQQFGKPVAGFQAVKHRCAIMLVAVERARSAVYGAVAAANAATAGSDPADLMRYTAQARLEADQAALFCSREAIQLHGGMGFTWEFDPHRFLRRAQRNSQRLGTREWWCEQVARHLLDASQVAEVAL